MENHIINQFNERDQKAFKVLFHELYPVLFRIAIKRVKDYQEAEDMVLIAFRKLWFWDKKFGDYVELKGHLICILENTCIDYLRKKKFIFKELREMEEREDQAKEGPDQNLIKSLYNNVSKLTTELKKLIHLELQGYSQKEISVIKNTKIDTVYHSRWAAIKKLRSLFKKQ